MQSHNDIALVKTPGYCSNWLLKSHTAQVYCFKYTPPLTTWKNQVKKCPLQQRTQYNRNVLIPL